MRVYGVCGKKKTFIFLISQAFSLLGSSLVQYALFWYVTLETKSGVAMTVYIVCGFLPMFFLSPFGGVWADRYDRRKLIVISDGFIAAVTLILAAVFATGGKSLALVMIVAALRAAGTAVQTPAVGAILPQLVPVEHLTRVNGISGTMQAVISILSPAASGVLVSIWPLYTVFLVDVVTAAAAILILLLFLEISPDVNGLKEKRHYFTDMKLGFVYIKEHPYLVSFFSYIGLYLFLITPAAMLTPLQVTRSFGSDVWRLTAIEIAFSGGMMIGGGIISIWGGFKNRVVTILVSSLLSALCTVGLGIVLSFQLYLGVMAHVENEYLGRVFSVNTMLFTSVMPAGMLIFGPLAERIRIESMLLVTGAAILVLVTAAFMHRRLMEAGRTVGPQPATASPSTE